MWATVRMTFQALSVRNFRLFAVAHLFKSTSVWMQFIAQDWLVLELSDNSASTLGLVTGLQFLPVLLLTLYGGKVADRHDRRRVLVIANTTFFALGLAMGILVSTGHIALPIVYVFAGLMGVVNAIETPVRQAFVSELVQAPLMPNALGLSAAIFNASRILGPAITGVGIWAVGLGPVFLLVGLSYLVPPVMLARMDRDQLLRGARSAQRPRIRDGLTYAARHHELLLPLTLLLVIGTVGFNFPITLAVLAKTVFTTGAQQFGLLSASLAAGALVGSLVSGARSDRPEVSLVLGSGLAFGALETVVGFGPNLWLTALLLVPTGFAMIFLLQATIQSIQLGVDPEFRGRVMALFVLVNLGTTPIGGPIIGAVMQRLGPRSGLWIGGAVSMAAALAALAWHLRHADARLRLRWRPLPGIRVVPRLAPDPDSGVARAGAEQVG